MTVRDPEILELLRDEPELLALADAVAETQRPPTPSRIRWAAPRAAGVAAVVAAVVAVVLFAPGGGGGHGIVDRALAAIGNGRVMHLVMRMPSGEVLVDLKTGKRIAETIEVEDWSDQTAGREHLLMRVHGVVADFVFPDDAHGGTSVREVDPAFAALTTGYREALESGDAKLEREDVIAGRPVYWLRFASVEPDRPGTEVAIAQDTYKPLVFRTTFGGRHIDSQVLVAETIDFNPSDFKRVGPNLFDAGGSSSSGSSFNTNEPFVVKAPWLTLGESFAGLTLSEAHQLQVTARGKSFEGVELVYGGTTGGRQSLSIQQLSEPDDPLSWKHVPRGWVSIQEGTGSDGRRSYPHWTANLVKEGVYLTIETGLGEQAVLEAARGLHTPP